MENKNNNLDEVSLQDIGNFILRIIKPIFNFLNKLTGGLCSLSILFISNVFKAAYQNKILFVTTVLLALFCRFMTVSETPKTYVYNQMIEIAHNADDAVQDIDTVVTDLRYIVIPRLLTKYLESHNLVARDILSHRLNMHAVNREEKTYIFLHARGNAQAEFANVFADLLRELQIYQQPMIQELKSDLQGELALNIKHANTVQKLINQQIAGLIQPGVQHSTAKGEQAKNNTRISPALMNESLLAAIYNQGKIANMIAHEKYMYSIQSEAMRLSRNLSTLQPSHYVSPLNVIAVRDQRGVFKSVLFAFLIGLLVAFSAEQLKKIFHLVK